MKKQIVTRIVLSMALFCLVGVGFGAEPSRLTLWYDKPATAWEQALPIGNGRMGAMIFGGVEKERIQFNESTLWTGAPHDYSHPDAVKVLPEIRQLLFDGKQKQAEDLAMAKFMSIPLGQEKYQPFGDLWIELAAPAKVEGYRRQLDLETATAQMQYTADGVGYTRTVFASYPDRAIVVRLQCDRPSGLNGSIWMTSPHAGAESASDGNTLILRGKVKQPGCLKFESRLQIRAEGGKVEYKDGRATLAGVTQAVLILTAATSYKDYQDTSGDPAEMCKKALADVAGKGYEALHKTAVEDYRRLFSRVSLDVGTSSQAGIPTDQRVAKFKEGNDPALAELYFQFGRYLLISSSRPGGQPANLQGLWNDKMSPPWDSKWTVNINTEMNYWPAEPTNLSECHEPLFDMIADVSKTGRTTAKVHYGANGWVLHHNTDVWRGTAPINHSNHGIWVTGGAWLCQHLWYRYQFTGDKAFLRDRAYPILKEAAAFFVDFLVEDPKTKYLISTPSNSPENGGLVAGPTMDHQIIRDLFNDCIEASIALGVDENLRKVWVEKRDRLAPSMIGKYGQLQEWLEDKDNPKDEHRHISHLYGLYPSGQINQRGTPQLYAAARKSLEFRGDGGTGWSMGWKINTWARLHDGDHAFRMLTNQLTPQRTYPNLFDAHPPFQIDGNFGATSGICEMLLQSQAGEVELLPALPSAWKNGSVRGLCARGGFGIDLEWKDGKLAAAKILSRIGGLCKLRYGEITVQLETKAGETYALNGQLQK
jgi:alpha-L-fucosidase 2